jgi:anti-sigma-K factor RskA
LTCDERKDLLLLYASDVLDTAEATELRTHLQTGCPVCAGFLAEAQALLASVPLGLDRVDPPAHLKSRLMQRIADSEKRDPIAADVLPSDSLPMRLFRYLVPAAVAAGLAIIATHFVMNQHVTQLQQQAVSLQHQNELYSTAMANQQQQLELLHATNQRQNQLVQSLTSPDLRLINLQPTAAQPHAVANLLWDRRQQQWTILTDGMTAPPPGQTYELWFVPKTGAPVAAGTFDVDSTGRGTLRAQVPTDIGPLALAAVTNEAAGGVPAPKGNFQITGKVD